jgi:hypothetical protein
MAKKKDTDNKSKFVMSAIVMACLIIIALLVLDKFGVLEGDSGEALGRADLICFLSGYPKGVDTDLFKENKTGYIFECDKEQIPVIFDRDSGVGYIGHQKD